MVNDKQVEETARVLVLDGWGVCRLHHGNRFLAIILTEGT